MEERQHCMRNLELLAGGGGPVNACPSDWKALAVAMQKPRGNRGAVWCETSSRSGPEAAAAWGAARVVRADGTSEKSTIVKSLVRPVGPLSTRTVYMITEAKPAKNHAHASDGELDRRGNLSLLELYESTDGLCVSVASLQGRAWIRSRLRAARRGFWRNSKSVRMGSALRSKQSEATASVSGQVNRAGLDGRVSGSRVAGSTRSPPERRT